MAALLISPPAKITKSSLFDVLYKWWCSSGRCVTTFIIQKKATFFVIIIILIAPSEAER